MVLAVELSCVAFCLIALRSVLVWQLSWGGFVWVLLCYVTFNSVSFWQLGSVQFGSVVFNFVAFGYVLAVKLG